MEEQPWQNIIQVIQCAFDIAKATKQLVALFQVINILCAPFFYFMFF